MQSDAQTTIIRLLEVSCRGVPIGPATLFVEDLGLDSMRLLAFLTVLEAETGVDVFSRGLDVTRVQSVEALAQFIEAHAADRASGAAVATSRGTRAGNGKRAA